MDEPDADALGALTLAEYRPGEAAVLTDAERWPTATATDLERLQRWRQHPDAPAWTHATGDRLSAEQAAAVREPLPVHGWLEEHLATARRTLRYRNLPGLERIEDFPTSTRADLVKDIAAFVPLDADLQQLVHGTSSGSTGAALVIPDHVEDVARTFHLLRRLGARCGADIAEGAERMVLANLVHQRQAFTYVSLVSSFSHRTMARINLDPACWPEPESRRRFLADADPQVLSGHPTSVAALLDPSLQDVLHPRLIVSAAMDLSPALRSLLTESFDCPVLDIYALHETRPIAWRDDDGPFRVLDRRVLVEFLDDAGAPVPDGAVGEITVTAGENPLLPLVRYRTGDYGRSVRLPDGSPGIADLQGREHVIFRDAAGRPVPSVDLTQQLQAHGALGWTVEQDAHGHVDVRLAGGSTIDVRRALTALLGEQVTVEQVHELSALGPGKPRRYRSAARPLQDGTGAPHR